MALPPELATVTLTGTYVDLDGSPTVGYLIFQPSPTILRAAASREFVVPKTMQANLDDGGLLSIVLPANDDPDITPVDWTYQVTEAFGSRRTYSIELHVANGATQNIYDLAPVALANGTYYLQGDRGPAGPDVLTTTGQPSPTTGDDGDKAIDVAAGIIYTRTGALWDNGVSMGTSSPTGGTLVRRDANGRLQVATPSALGDASTKGYVDSGDATTVTNAHSYTDTAVAPLAPKVAPTFTGPVQVNGNQTINGALYINSGTVTGAPAAASDITNKSYVDGQVSAETTARTNADTNLQNQVTSNTTNISSNTTALGTKVQIGGDLGGTITAPQVTSGTHHTHTSAQVSDATDQATPSTLAKRDSSGGFSAQYAWVSAAPTNAAHATRKDYVDAGDHGFLINYQSGTAYTTVLSDAGTVVRMNNAAAMTVTIPPNSSVAYPTGTWIEFERTGAGTLTLAPGAGVTINAPDGDKTVRVTNSRVRMLKTGTDIWYLSGDNNSATDQAVTTLGGRNAASGYVGLDASSNASVAGTLVASTSLQTPALLLPPQATTPSNPTGGVYKEYLDANGRSTIIGSTGTLRMKGYYWGSGTSFPAGAVLSPGDTYLHTGLGCLMTYNGTAWRQEEIPQVANAAARTTISTSYASSLYTGFRVRQTDTGNTWEWNGSAWKAVPDYSFPVAMVHQATANSGLATGWNTISFDTEDIDTHSAFTTGTVANTTASSKFTVPAGQDGIYACEGSAFIVVPATVIYNARLLKNGATVAAGQGNSSYNGITSAQPLSAGTGRHLLSLVAGDYIQLQGYTSGNSFTTGSSTTYPDGGSWLAIERVR